jgi:hypothetical protein
MQTAKKKRKKRQHVTVMAIVFIFTPRLNNRVETTSLIEIILQDNK